MTRRDRARRKRAIRLPLLLSFVFLLGAVTIWVCAGSWVEASISLRAHGRAVTAFLGRVWGILPTPVSELLVIVLPLLGIILPFVRLARGGWARMAPALCRLLCAVCLLFFFFVCWYGVQYTAPPLADSLGLEVHGASVEELRMLVRNTVDTVNEYAAEVPRDRSGVCSFGSFSEQAALAMRGYEALAEKYPVFSAHVAAPKRSRLLSIPMSYVGNAGYFFPWTGEAIVNYDNVQTHIPFNIAHESAHSRGIGPEAECNFAAYLACMESGDSRLIYSASINAYIYAANALYEQSPDLWEREFKRLCEEAKNDIRLMNAHFQKYEGPILDFGLSVNDRYIKATGQPDGIQSYGLMVDLLLAYEAQRD